MHVILSFDLTFFLNYQEILTSCLLVNPSSLISILLINGDGEGLLHASFAVFHREGSFAGLIACLHHHHELAMEELHGGSGEHFERGGVAVAGGTEGAVALHREFELISGIGAQRAVLVNKAHSHKCEVVAVGLEAGAVAL